eukprot:4848875-Pleurochrysis_carterae.AAC.5
MSRGNKMKYVVGIPAQAHLHTRQWRSRGVCGGKAGDGGGVAAPRQRRGVASRPLWDRQCSRVICREHLARYFEIALVFTLSVLRNACVSRQC